PQFGLLVRGREWVASLDRGKAALWTERQPLQGHVLGRRLDPCLDSRDLLQYGALRGQQPEHYRVLRQDVPQWVKVPGPRRVVLQEQRIDIGEVREQGARYGFITAVCHPAPTGVVATTDVQSAGDSTDSGEDGV